MLLTVGLICTPVSAQTQDLDDTIIPGRGNCENNWPTYLIITGMGLLILSRKKHRTNE